ncbi:MAG: DNA polymerase I [Candidatus Omnitrophota bacterium]
MPEKIFIIDSMYLLFSSFYSNRNMRTFKGEPTGAIFGFVTRIESLIRDEKPDRIGVAIDSSKKTFRHDLYEPYKAKRLVAPEDLSRQIPLAKEYLNLRDIPLFEIPGFEADDIIAACAKAEAAKGNEVYIVSADKDLFQLVGGNIYCYHPKLKQKLDAAGVKEHFGIAPEQIVDFLSLTGDTSDNIPGVPGIGEKTAQKIITTFGSIDHLLQHLDQLDEKNRKRIEENLDAINVSRNLIDLSAIPPLNHELTIKPFKNELNPLLKTFYQRLAFHSLLKRFEEDFPEEEKPQGLDIAYHIVKDIEQLRELKHKILEKKYFAFDVETTSLDFFKAQLVGISISFKNEGYYIPLEYAPIKAKVDGVTVGLADFKTELADVFSNPDIKKAGHNLKFDILNLNYHGIDVQGIVDDSIIMSYLLHPNRRTHNLKELTFELLNYKQTDYEQLAGKEKNQKNLCDIDIDVIAKYCIEDSYLSLRLIETLKKDIEKKKLVDLYCNIEMPLIDVLTDMETTGVKIDVDFLKRSAKDLEEKCAALEKEVCGMAGCLINLNSSQQLGKLLFETMQLPTQKRTRKTRSYSTDIEVLNELKDFPIVAKIIDYRIYKKLLSTYVEALIDTVDPHHRVHTSYNQTIAATGRLSSSNPNLQNIPVGEIGGIDVRDAFISEENNLLLAADYSQIELRVMAHFSEDPNLMDAFEKDLDIHQYTSDTVFKDDLVSSPQLKRKRAKIVNFSILYGTGAFSLSKELGVSFKDAKTFIDLYFEKYAGVKQFINGVIAKAEEEIEVQTLSGRRRDIPEILSANRNVKENGNRMAINSVVQGSAADIIKIAMINIFRKLKASNMKSKLVMQVHDELIFEYPAEEENQLFEIVKHEMEHAVLLRVPLRVKLQKGKKWGKLEKVTLEDPA